MEDAEGRRAACRAALHCQLTWPRAGDGEIVVYEEFAAGERDRLAFERGIELNRVSIAGRSDRTAQRAGAAVVGVGNDDDVSMRGDCDSEKQCHGSHGGPDVEYDSHFHSTSANHGGIVMHQKLIPSLTIYSFVLIRGFLDMLGCCVI